MSLKGFGKSLGRAPQQFRQRFNMGEITKDAVYQDAERRFAELEIETNKLKSESTKYFDSINNMLKHQIEFSRAIAEIYKPISGRMSDPNSYVAEGNPEGIQACEEYEQIVKDLQETLKPELELIETRIIRPSVELLEIIKVIRKLNTKRDHKQLDYDRHNNALKKLQDKKEKTAKDEKAMYKAEADVQNATQEYEYYNDLLKDELPKFFELEREFIGPLFQSFYYMQLNVFYTLHERMQSIDIGYFDLSADIQEGFQSKRGEIQSQAEQLAITHWKTRPPRLGPAPGANKFNRPALTAPNKPLAIEAAKPSASRTSVDSTPPPYSPPPNGTASPASSGAANPMGVLAAAKAKPPPPVKPKPKQFGAAAPVETVTALYDYEAQAAGDLSFSAGDVIEIVSRTQNENEWWTGKVHGKQGQFPGNYVQLG